MNARTLRLAALVLAAVALWFVARRTGLSRLFEPAFLQQQFAAHAVTGLLVFALLFALGNLVQVPGLVFLAAAVLALGRLWGGLATYFAAIVGCFVTFVLVRAVGGDALHRLDGRIARRLIGQLDAHPVRSVALLRVLLQTSPAVNYALALSGVPLRSYMIGTVIGLPVPITTYTLFFDQLAQWWHLRG